MSSSIEFTALPTSDPLDIDLEHGPILPTTYPPTPSSNASQSNAPSRLLKKPTLSAKIEQLTDKAIDGLGPVLLCLAFILLSVCTFAYFSVVLPYHYQWQEGEGIFGNLGYIINMTWSCYLVWGIAANYYYA
ncbi:hypothetical protein BG000_004515, partial [Podila horticola]